MVDNALRKGVLCASSRIGVEPVHAAYSRHIFERRNFVAHRGLEASSKDAAGILVKAREVVEYVHGHRD